MSEFQEVVSDGAQVVGNKLKRWLLYALVFILIIGGITLWAASWTYSDGTRAGYLVKATRKGTVFKTYEGQLNTGGFQTGAEGDIIGNIWDFSVLDDEVYTRLQEMEGEKVRLAYKQRYKSFAWQAKTDYIVYDVEKVGE